jgi:hypothetical protein
MTERLLSVDYEKLRGKVRNILISNAKVPANCPKETCLNPRKITLDESIINVAVWADPPELPLANPQINICDTNPICDICQIEGNSNRYFSLTQNIETGKVLDIRVRWKD